LSLKLLFWKQYIFQVSYSPPLDLCLGWILRRLASQGCSHAVS
jgi:hypothetical protein